MADLSDDSVPAPDEGLQYKKLVEAARARAEALSRADTMGGAEDTKADEKLAARSDVAQRTNAPENLGRFELLERLGQGGFATVWKAFDPHLDRVVAVKIPRCEELSATEAELFLREARSASQVRHTHVVRLHEVGRAGDLIYLVSDLVDGQSLDKWLTQQGLSPSQAALLCRTLAQALSAIHDAGIIHRDLKPANILIDGMGEPHITDFGLAKRRGAEATLTLDGQMMGTPAYMSPEQARGESRYVSHSSDIYSLGVILFELLTGDVPFRGQPHLVMAKTINDDPPAPRVLNPLIPEDLETICLRCLEKDPNSRFASAADLSSELERFLRGEPIESRPISPARRALRWCRRYPVSTTLLAVLAAVAILGPLLALRFRALATEALAAQSVAESTEREKSELLYVSQMNSVEQAAKQGDYVRGRELLAQQIPSGGQADLRDFEWYYWNRQFKRGLEWELGPFGRLESVVVSHDGQWLAWGGERGIVTIRNVATDESFDVPAQIDAEGRPLTVYCLGFSPVQNLLAVGRNDRSVEIFDVAARRTLRELPTEGQSIRALAFADDARTLAVGTGSGTLELWSDFQAESRRVIKVTEHSLRSLDFSSDGQKVVAVINSFRKFVGGLCCVDLATGKKTADWESKNEFRAGLVAKLSTDEKEIYFDKDLAFSVQRLDARTLQTLGSPLVFPSQSSISTIAVTNNGQRVVAGGDRGELVAWDLTNGQVTETWSGHDDFVMAIAMFPDGRHMVSCSFDGYVRCWNIGQPDNDWLLAKFPGRIYSLCFSPDSQRIYATGSDDRGRSGAIVAFRVPSGEIIWQRSFERHSIHRAVASPDGSLLVTTHTHGVVRFWDAQAGELLEETRVHQHDRRVLNAEFSADGRYLATSEGLHRNPPFTDELTEQVVIWDVARRQVVSHWSAHDRKAALLLFGPAADQILSYGWDKRIRRWRISTKELLAEFDSGPKIVRGIHLVDNGQTLVAVDSDCSIRRWNVSSGKFLGNLIQRQGHCVSSALSPSGMTLAVPSMLRNVRDRDADGKLLLVDTRTWESKCALETPDSSVHIVAFSPNGEYLAGGCFSGQIFLWHAPRE
ncbi:MAG: protein kinase [Planctomycetota bacterium]